MAKFKPYEMIMLISPKAYTTADVGEVCFTVKPVSELVRCKDCGNRLKDGYCPNARCFPADDWFCADGVRKKDEDSRKAGGA